MPPKGYKQSEACKEKLRIFHTGKKTPREVLDKINATKIKNRSAFYKRSEQAAIVVFNEERKEEVYMVPLNSIRPRVGI